ncbi:SH3 domain-containing protein [Devosia sp. Root105]|uniref:SH3 domain-containing protein n=1 Tax=Devosia sp. Root105 TaxID=1736423 RepID=UPI0006FEEF32|nr:SH3 domain-containing protein [Devosia sp. Root105]KQU95172.1 hypothetical protein ASC68_18635 [Devosia sp. Root105]
MKLPPLFGSALLIGLLSTGAMAAEAVSGANVRSGPGASFGVVDTLAAGESVTVTECAANGWCRVDHSGPDGWVSAKLLADNGNADDYYNAADGGVEVARNFDDDDGYPRLIGRAPDVNVRFGFGFGNGLFGFRDGLMMGRPGRDRGDVVCLVTFFSRDDVAAGRDADVQRAQILSRRVAERNDGPNDRRAIFEYGSERETIRTCRYLDRLN